MEISGFPRGGVHVSKGGCTCKQKGCTGRCSLFIYDDNSLVQPLSLACSLLRRSGDITSVNTMFEIV